MKILSIVIGGFATLVAGAAFADAPCKTDCVTKITTDFSGRPPFKRTVEVLSAVDVAQLELEKIAAANEIEGEWVNVTTVDYSGRPPFKPTDEERKHVGQMVAVGIPQEQIAMVIRDGIDADTLAKHFKKEIRESKILANAKVGGTLFNKVMNGDTSAAIFWAKTQMGWKETNVQEHTGKIETIERVFVDGKINDPDA